MSKFKTDEMTYAAIQDNAQLLRQISDLSEQINLGNERHAAALKEYRAIHAKEMDELQELFIGCERTKYRITKEAFERMIAWRRIIIHDDQQVTSF
jgi:hypothetical protein